MRAGRMGVRVTRRRPRRALVAMEQSDVAHEGIIKIRLFVEVQTYQRGYKEFLNLLV